MILTYLNYCFYYATILFNIIFISMQLLPRMNVMLDFICMD